jgi:hypothetical protein
MVNGKASRYSNRDADFLMGLGSLYLTHNLLDPAGELLAQIPSEDALYVEAAGLQIEIQSRKQNYQEVIRLGETLANRLNLPKWLLGRIGIAYYFLGQASNAKSYFLRSLRQIPENSQVKDKLQPLRSLNDRPKIEELIVEGYEIGISPHVALDCIAPILWGRRPTSCCFTDQLLSDDQPNNSEPDHQNFYLKFAADLYQRFGIFTAFLPYVDLSLNQCAPLVKVFFSLDASLFDRVEDIKESAWKEFERQEGESNHRLEYLEKEGSLLGYPKCCIEWSLHNRRSNKSIEALALSALIEEEYVCSLKAAKALRPELAYFAFEFYPCNPRCVGAEQVGYDIFEHYRKTEALLSNIYCHHVLSVNKAKMYYPVSYYADFIDNFNKTIVRILKFEEFKKTHEDFDLYGEEMLAILKERPDLDAEPDALSVVYKEAKGRVSQKFITKKWHLIN